MAEWRDGWWRSAEGLRLHYRDYPGDPARVPVLCIPGLTRNARDFANLAADLAPGRRVIAVDLRGRGQSEHAADPVSYQPGIYLHDIGRLLAALGLPKVALFGTSLGGIIAMLMAATMRPVLAGALLNDVGPVIEAAGVARIRSYVGTGARWPDMAAAARAQAAIHGAAYPDYADAEWLAMAERLCRAEPDGMIVSDYDARIALPFAAPPPDPPVDMWPMLEALAGLPVLLVRGALSDILGEPIAAEMARRLPGLETVTIPATGHAPTLDEPEARAGIARLLARIDAEPVAFPDGRG